MIKLDRSFVTGVQAATHPEELYEYLQKAVELEHSTIPPYLTAMFSLEQGKNDTISGMIRSIVVQEMLHMTIAGNILIAIGGAPKINKRGFVPSYPGPLPMNIGGSDFKVGIEAFSKPLVEKIFMVIEEPEDPIPIRERAMPAAVPDFATIGEFYQALQKKILELGDRIFVPATSRQVLNGRWFNPEVLFAITGAVSAVRAIEIIIREGEGTRTSPFQSPGDFAHYYKFYEIYKGLRIVTTKHGFAFGDEEIPFDERGVHRLKANCKVADFAPGSQAHTRIVQFNSSYNDLLNALHTCFNGEPARIDAAIGLMYTLKMEAVALMRTPIEGSGGLMVGPSYEYART
jgi:hypothetical protein